MIRTMTEQVSRSTSIPILACNATHHVMLANAQKRCSGDIHFPDCRRVPDLGRRGILDIPSFDAHFRAHLHQAVSSVYSPVGQDDWVVFHITLSVVCIG